MEQNVEKKVRFKNIKEIGLVVKNSLIGTKTRDENGNVIITKEALTWKGKTVVKRPDGSFEEVDCRSVKRLLIGIGEAVVVGGILVIGAGVANQAINGGNDEIPAIEDGNVTEETPIE